jgi:hypothetical protein
MLTILKEIPSHLRENGYALFRISLKEPDKVLPLWEALFFEAGLEYEVILKYTESRWENDNVMHFYTQAIVKITPKNENKGQNVSMSENLSIEPNPRGPATGQMSLFSVEDFLATVKKDATQI